MKLVKVIMLAAALAFVGGCVVQKPAPTPAPVVVKAKHHASKHCKGKKCLDKFGSASQSSAK
ncbi:MAG: hypothetical protein WCW01_04200 [Gammaproteobacteria bacterium]